MIRGYPKFMPGKGWPVSGAQPMSIANALAAAIDSPKAPTFGGSDLILFTGI